VVRRPGNTPGTTKSSARRRCLQNSLNGTGGLKMLQLLLHPLLQLLHSLLVPVEILIDGVGGHLVAVVGVDGHMDLPVLAVNVVAVAELPDGAGVDIGPVEPLDRQLCELRMHVCSPFRATCFSQYTTPRPARPREKSRAEIAVIGNGLVLCGDL